MQLEYFKYWCSCYYYKNIQTTLWKIKSSQAKYVKAKGYKIIMWDVLVPTKNITKEKCLDNVISI
jgi:hypothetical protein